MGAIIQLEIRQGKIMKNIVKFVMLVLAFAYSANLMATTIDFEGLAKSDDSVTFLTGTYTDSGYLFTAGNPSPYSFATVGSLHPRFGGSTAFSTYNFTTISIKNVDGDFFDLGAMDVAPIFLGENDPFGPDRAIGVDYLTKIYGLRNGVSFVEQDILLPNNTAENVLTNVDMIGFEGLNEVVIMANNYPGVQIDNLMLSVSSVPEPSSYGLLLLGLSAVFTIKRKHLLKR